MINLIEAIPRDAVPGTSPVEMYQFTENGDTLIVTPSIPFLGLTQIVNAPTVFYEEWFGATLDIYVKYSLDEGLTWSENKLISEIDFSSISFQANHVSLLEFTLVQNGDGVIYFYGIDFSANSIEVSSPSVPEFYKELGMKIPYYNFESLRWSLNVLQKVYQNGILPKFIERGDNENWLDEDFIDFWWALIYPMSLRIAMAQDLVDLLWRPDLLKEYLRQRGIVIGNTTNLIELCHLMYFFYDEEARRGSLSVLDLERTIAEGETIRGPIARLIDYVKGSDVFFRRINSWELGWWLQVNSPCQYQNSDYIMNDRLDYENEPFTKSNSLDQYSLSQPSNIVCNQQGYAELTPGNEGGDLDHVGFGNLDNPKITIVSPYKDYAVIADFQLIDTTRVFFGIKGYNADDTMVEDWTYNTNSNTQDTFFEDNEEGFLLPAARYRLFGVLRNEGFVLYAWKNKVLDGLCMEKKFILNKGVVGVMPYLQFKNSNAAKVKVYDFKICRLEDQDIYLDSIINSESRLSLKNYNFSMTDEEIEKEVKTKLFPFEEANCEIIFE